MHITPQACAAVYDMLRHFKPFSGWKLPPADEVEFRVWAYKGHFAEVNHYVRTNERIMSISNVKHKTLDELAQTIAHEMCHIRQYQLKQNIGHGKAFKRMSRAICKELGWNERAF